MRLIKRLLHPEKRLYSLTKGTVRDEVIGDYAPSVVGHKVHCLDIDFVQQADQIGSDSAIAHINSGPLSDWP
ncbi:MAG: hypothetical protein AAFQ85_10015 [Pseudomonadota bacterium]